MMIFLSVGIVEKGSCARNATPVFMAIISETFSLSRVEHERHRT
jgi:hypothetical protein